MEIHNTVSNIPKKSSNLYPFSPSYFIQTPIDHFPPTPQPSTSFESQSMVIETLHDSLTPQPSTSNESQSMVIETPHDSLTPQPSTSTEINSQSMVIETTRDSLTPQPSTSTDINSQPMIIETTEKDLPLTPQPSIFFNLQSTIIEPTKNLLIPQPSIFFDFQSTVSKTTQCTIIDSTDENDKISNHNQNVIATKRANEDNETLNISIPNKKKKHSSNVLEREEYDTIDASILFTNNTSENQTNVISVNTDRVKNNSNRPTKKINHISKDNTIQPQIENDIVTYSSIKFLVSN